ncbi:MAG: helix-turn-helix transcriptional regulator [Anaerolineales bacterium]|nr:helix-turn-helix transcriptional regulator [Anaerolineales bacterium]
MALQLPPGYKVEEHGHGWAQFIYAARGVMRVEAQDRQWIVPPHRGLWMPAAQEHSIQTIGEVSMRTVYLNPELSLTLKPNIRVLDVQALLRELILEIVRLGVLREADEMQRSLRTLLIAQLAAAPELALQLPMPQDPRARQVADRVRREPGETAGLPTLAAEASASARTIERLFLKETGLTFGRWRQQARLQHAVCRLAEGADVTSIAVECGYESVSAFVAMFKQSLGTTPGQYLRS